MLMGFAALACERLPSVTPADLCRVDALVKVLPSDPDELSVGDLKDIVGRLKACSGGDAGTP